MPAVLGLALALAAASPAQAAQADPAIAVDRLWMAVAIALVLLMQIGFLFVECGFVRSKSTINVAIKNMTDLFFSVALFWLVGYMLMTGPSLGGWIGFNPGLMAADPSDPDAMLFLLFQAMFCGTAATVVSGALAERCSFWAYLAITAAIAVAIYPAMAHWAWSALAIPGNPGLLGDLGFMDFAGATVVHGTGAWVALAAIIVIGPRLGRLPEGAEPEPMPGHNPVLSGVGALLLAVGWLGFNGGSLLGAGDALAGILGATVIAGIFGGLGGLGYGLSCDRGLVKVDRPINGLLGGLVAVTAGCDVFGLPEAALVGLVGGLVAQVVNDAILRTWRLDDVVGAVGVHGAAGALGTLLVALLAPSDALLAGGRLVQLGVQALGVAVCMAWAFGMAWITLVVIGRLMPLRVSETAEAGGLNTYEHGVTLGTGRLQAVLARMLEDNSEDANLVAVEPGDESSEVSELFNLLLLRNKGAAILEDRLSRERIEQINARQRADDRVVGEINRLIERAATGDFSGRVHAPDATSTLRAVCGGINRMFEAVEAATGNLEAALGRLARGDFTTELDARGDGTFGEMSDTYNRAIARLRESGARSSAELSTMTTESHATAEQAVAALTDIERASADVLGIIAVIDEIASRTNMLALNASIEATRAGTHGKAFAVVAGEVRTLAGRVAEASAEIERISRANAEVISRGITAVGEIREALQRIEVRVGNVMNALAEAA